jgi:adenylate cyclase class 2
VTKSPLETELKIPVDDHESIRGNLRLAGAETVQAMAREVNLLLDAPDGRLRAAGSLLRLREHGDRQLITFKEAPSFKGAIKQRPEAETRIGDLAIMVEILDRLGFRTSMRYEKDREEWRMGEFSVVLDHTPMGDFVEVEGPAERLEQTAKSLGLEIADAVRGSYPSLWQDYRERHPEHDLPLDMVFPE